MKNPHASLSIDLDNLWAYLKVGGNEKWKKFPTYLDNFVPDFLEFLERHRIKTTFFIVGRDADREENAQWLAKIAAEGHEFGNHSYNHEPWMEDRSTAEIKEELAAAHLAIEKATGKSPVGFRGPGFCCNQNLLEAVRKMNYTFDASLFPTIIGPLARMYYMLRTRQKSKGGNSKRKNLFGSAKNGLMPLKPFQWNLSSGPLLEIPVTTIPMMRLPFHLSYIIWLSRFSKTAALSYFKTGLMLCKALGVEPSILLHPLDFLGKEDVPELSFFPGMDLSRSHKLTVAHQAMESLNSRFEVLTMSRHAKEMLVKMEKEHTKKLQKPHR